MSRRIAATVLAIALSLTLITALSPDVALASPSKSAGSGPTPNAYGCTPTWVYDHLTNQGNQFSTTDGGFRDYNGTPSNMQAQFTATYSTTVTVSATAGVTVDASVVVASVNTTFSVGVSTSVTAAKGNNVTITVPPYQYGNGKFGVYQQQVTGHYYYRLSNCSVGTDYGYVTTYSPTTAGWQTWLG